MPTRTLACILAALTVLTLLAGCGTSAVQPTNTVVPPTTTALPPTVTLVPPTAIPVRPTATYTPLPPTPTHTPTGTATPVPLPLISTSIGDLKIKKIEISDRYPPGCSPDPYWCHQAQEGRRLLIIWLQSIGSEPLEDNKALANEIFPDSSSASSAAIGVDSSGNLVTFYHIQEDSEASEGNNHGVHISSSAGFVTGPFAGGVDARKPFLAFQVPFSARDFTLMWPDNPPIELGQ
jgi:hypothetical protein